MRKDCISLMLLGLFATAVQSFIIRLPWNRAVLIPVNKLCTVPLKTKDLRRMSSTNLEASLMTCQRSSYDQKGISRVLKCEFLPLSNSYRVVLDNSILYPEGGGQPSDHGTVNGLPVLSVSKPSDGESFGESCVEVELPAPVDPDTEVECCIDWNRRYDFMQQHTAQHLFSAVADKLYKADTVGWALGSDSVTVDLTSTPLLTTDQLQHIEDETNAYIAQGLDVSWTVLGREDLEHVMNTDDTFRGMVKGAASALSSLRLVRIGGLDVNPCGGTHLRNLAEVNVLKIIGTEKDRKALRVRFVAGQRALKYFRGCVQREAALSQKLSAPPTEHEKLVDKLLLDRKDLDKKTEALQDEIAGYYGQELLQKVIHNATTSSSTSSSTPLILHRHRFQGSLKFLLRVATVVSEGLSTLRTTQINSNTTGSTDHIVPSTVVLYLTGGDLVDEEELTGEANAGGDKKKKKKSNNNNNISAAAASATSSPVSHPFVLFASDSAWLTEQRKNAVLAMLEAKGGGRPGVLQGQSTRVLDAKNDVLRSLAEFFYIQHQLTKKKEIQKNSFQRSQIH